MWVFQGVLPVPWWYYKYLLQRCWPRSFQQIWGRRVETGVCVVEGEFSEREYIETDVCIVEGEFKRANI